MAISSYKGTKSVPQLINTLQPNMSHFFVFRCICLCKEVFSLFINTHSKWFYESARSVLFKEFFELLFFLLGGITYSYRFSSCK
jgi:hypothetical protein